MSTSGLDGRRIVLGVSGGIAAYKAADLASKLVQAAALVDVVMTRGAEAFVRPLTFAALTRRTVHTDMWAPWTQEMAGHVTLAAEAEAIVVAPATANAIARLANGLAEDLLGAIYLSTTAPLIVAPAMEHHMYNHPATQANLATLRERGATIVGPDSGRLASGETGNGRLVSTSVLLDAVRNVLGRDGPLAGKRVVVTAGGTQEPIDPIRAVTNRSSGQMGYALARAALALGASVTLITTPTGLTAPWGAEVTQVTTAAEMLDAVTHAVVRANVLIMAAAVADFRPATVSREKIRKREQPSAPTITLEPTTDILAAVRQPGLLKVGFAAETEDLIARARSKLHEKGLALIVANDAVATIGAASSTASLISADGSVEALPHQSKETLAAVICERLASLLARRG